ncbi:putative phosphoglycerate mutase [Azomonas macrocytogenes]|uniref:Putative phosphoglycerate mutase n=1 Tax=Azomonas macrocytogenes TaxID=69962 RepID=A0A839TB82_AZOMA|nr:putative phosphoglycerate mutase [Azomonas macrocytogenes]
MTWLNLDTANLDFLASPLVRAQETMRSVRHQLGLDPTAYRTDDRLMEISFGKWEGLSWQHIQAEHPKEYRAHLADPLELAIPGGESWRMVFTRVAAVLKSLERDTLIVAHAGILRACLKLQGGVDERLAPNLDIPQNRILIMRNGHFAWLQANSTPDGSQAMLSQTSPG